MNKIYDLGLSRNYIRDWTVDDAVRELTQNCVDEGDYEITLLGDGVLSLRNNNSNGISVDKLVLGQTSKYDDETKIGKFGEGFKLALLVLLREGHNVTIVNNGLLWKPFFKQSDNFECETLHIESTEDNDTGFVDFCIEGCSDIIDELADVNLIVKESIYGEVDYIDTEYGRLLKDDSLKGQIFVGGLYVQDNDIITNFGFDFLPEHVSLDRDRHAINHDELCSIISKMIVSTKDAELIYSKYNNKDINEDIISELKYSSSELKEEFLDIYKTRRNIEDDVCLITSNMYEYLELNNKLENGEVKYRSEKDEDMISLYNNYYDLDDEYDEVYDEYDKWNDIKNLIPEQLRIFNESKSKKLYAIINKYGFDKLDKGFLKDVANDMSTYRFSKIRSRINYDIVNSDDYKIEDLLD